MLNFRKIIEYKHSTLSNTLKFWDSNIFDFPKELLPWKVLAIRQPPMPATICSDGTIGKPQNNKTYYHYLPRYNKFPLSHLLPKSSFFPLQGSLCNPSTLAFNKPPI